MASQPSFYNVPVFPLHAVLFPGMSLALHIFEERYNAMVRDVLRGGKRFCVALIKDGVEVGGAAEPFDVSCLAGIAHLKLLNEGRYFLLTTGLQRVRILSLDRIGKPYLQATVQEWPDAPATVDGALLAEAAHLYRQYAGCLARLTGEDIPGLAVPPEPGALSFLIAATLQINPRERQRLLEVPGSGERIAAEVAMLRSELPPLQAMAMSPRPPKSAGPFSAN